MIPAQKQNVALNFLKIERDNVKSFTINFVMRQICFKLLRSADIVGNFSTSSLFKNFTNL